MTWDDILLDDQREAASHTGVHSRLLAGPGTGKTLVITRRILYLAHVLAVPADEILCLTFTRAAAQELRQRAREALAPDSAEPKIYTLHSFALRQLLLNSDKLDHLPRPLRIADDWEERNIVQEDIKEILDLSRIDEVQDLLNLLSADWQSLVAEGGNYTPNPRFIGAWQEHRSLFGYTLRSELVFQLKRALEHIPDFELEAPFQHLLVDEYQDLNRCDLAIVQALTSLGPQLFVAGDDDQSIYGFREAHPEGIRSFLDEYPGSRDLSITVCMRCDADILNLAEFVANLDPDRLQKGTMPEDGRPGGEVALLGFSNQLQEAQHIASLCRCLIRQDGYDPSDILILSRINTHNAFSRVLQEAFDDQGIPFSADMSAQSPLDDPSGRCALALLRLLRDESDHLAWRTLLQLRQNLIGTGILASLLDLCRRRGVPFSQLLAELEEDNTHLERYGTRVAEETQAIHSFLTNLREKHDLSELDEESLATLISEVIEWSTDEPAEAQRIENYVSDRLSDVEPADLFQFVALLETTDIDIEQEIDPDSVNMLTMHKAKGLTSEAVIVLAAEDELIPGRQMTEPRLGDERRLLFVSLSRAKHKLFVSFCSRRTGQQRHLGRSDGSPRRTLTRFLRYAPIEPVSGVDYIDDRCQQ